MKGVILMQIVRMLALVCLGFPVLYGAELFYARFNLAEIHTWKPVEASVIDSTRHWKWSNKAANIATAVTYRYRYNGNSYTNDQLLVPGGDLERHRLRHKNRLLSVMESNTPVTVMVNMEDPSNSVLILSYSDLVQ